MVRHLFLIFYTAATVFWIGCSANRVWRVRPGQPECALVKGKTDEPYSRMLERFNGFQTGAGWVDLRPSMRIQVENAYYEPGKPKRGLEGFIGTERIWYRKPEGVGLTVGESESKMLATRPEGEPQAVDLLPEASRGFGAYRLFFSIRVNRRGDTRGAVLLGARTQAELESRAAALLANPDAVCGAGSVECVVFPEVCTASVEVEVKVNGEPRVYLWGTYWVSVAKNVRVVKLTRTLGGKRSVVEIDGRDANALRLPLLPGDEIVAN